MGTPRQPRVRHSPTHLRGTTKKPLHTIAGLFFVLAIVIPGFTDDKKLVEPLHQYHVHSPTWTSLFAKDLRRGACNDWGCGKAWSRRLFGNGE